FRKTQHEMNDRKDRWITAQIVLFFLISECHTQQEWRVPDPPENVRSKADAESVTLWWEPPASINEILVRGYTISYGIGTPSRRVIIEGAYTNAFTVNGLKPNTTYVFALTAYNEAEGEDSEKVLLTATTKLPKKFDDRLFQLQTPSNVHAKAISPNAIEVRWTDPNVDFENDNSVEAASRKRIYVIQYGIHQSEKHERLTAQVRQAVLGGLQPGTEYEIAVKVVMPDGAESAWSIRELVRTPNKSPSPLWPKSFDERCHFEDPSICGFTSDENAPLIWMRSQAGANAYLPNSVLGTPGGHYMTLQSTSSPHENYGRLISKSFKFNNGSHLCISLWIYVKDESRGVMTIRLHKENDQKHALTVFFAQLNKLRKESWELLLLNVRAPDVPFQLSFEVRKIGNEHFWIAIDDIDILSGRCPKEAIAVSRGTASFSVRRPEELRTIRRANEYE
uniref:Collagen alpha-1(XVIII) chain n=1 Tax=Parascaris univalens TaxID=6257 RepID=A0A915C7S4_PARUN